MVENVTNIPAPRVDFIDKRTGLMSREWYRFFLNLFTLVGAGREPIDIEELLILPPPQDIGNITTQLQDEFEKSQVASSDGSQIAEIDKALQALASYDQAAYLLSEVAVLRTLIQDNALQNQVAALLANQAEMQKQIDALSTQPVMQPDRDKTLIAGANITLTETVDTTEIAVSSTIDFNAGTIDGIAIGASSASTGAFTTLSASSTVSGTGFSTYLASPPAIGGTAPAAGTFTQGTITRNLAGVMGLDIINTNTGASNTARLFLDSRTGTADPFLLFGGGSANPLWTFGMDVSSNSVKLGVGNGPSSATTVAEWTTTGVAITGTLAATGTLNSGGGAWFGTAALATGATTGHVYIPTSAGAPTGVPATKTGQVAIQFDTTNNKLYVYDGGWLSTPALT